MDRYHRLGIYNLDWLYSRSIDPKILNSRELMTRNVAKEISSAVFSESTAEISYVPQCICGYTRGTYHGDLDIPAICPKCKTLCDTRFANMNFDAWFRIPQAMPPLMHPAFYGALHKILGVDLTRLLDISAPDHRIFKIVPYRGYREFYEHFDEILEILSTRYTPIVKRKEKYARMMEFMKMVHEYRDCVFSRYFPVLNACLHVETSEGKKKFIDKQSSNLLDMAVNLSCFDFNVSYGQNRSERWVNRRTHEIYTTYLGYIKSIINNKLAKKKGMLKHHGSGTRMHFTMRAVIAPISGPHSPDDVHLPWKGGLTIYEPEIINFMTKADPKLRISEIITMIRKAYYMHVPLVSQAVDYVESSRPTLTIGRNPSIEYGSSALFTVTHIKRDINDHTMNVSMSNVERLNADCDGDELYVISLKEQGQIRRFELLRPHYYQLSQSDTKISTSITPPKQLSVQAFARLDYDTVHSSVGRDIIIERN